MLTDIKIKKLFGLYDYDLNFSRNSEDKIRFITATNGYGKTTILRLIDGLFNHYLEVFFDIPFEKAVFVIDGTTLSVHQSKRPSQRNKEEIDAVDEKEDIMVAFYFGMRPSTEPIILSRSELVSGTKSLDSVLRQIEMFFSSEKCKFIDDRRLLRENGDDSELVRMADKLKDDFTNDNLQTQIALFKEIVDKSYFADKHMEMHPSFGFRFISNNEDKTKLTMKDLSSGEKHILLISLYILFEAPQKAIILVDEPEMSFHLSWQGDYLKNLRKIIAIKNVQCIIATHSPFIFDSEYDLSIDLYEQMHKN